MITNVDVKKIIQERKERSNALQDVILNISACNKKIESLESQINQLQKKRDKLSRKKTKYKKMLLREKIANKAATIFEKIYKAFAEDSRLSIEQLTREEFKKFVFSASEYKVALTDNYELQLLDSNGNPALQRLSMGQSQCLSLAFITAISRVSGKNPPIVIDMPFGRLDREVHEQVSKRLPEIASQLILFLIPDIEWNEVTSKNLEPKANHIYFLEFDEKNRITTIHEVK